MGNWFGQAVDQSFDVFSMSHYMMLLIYLVITILLLFTYKQISIRPKLYQVIRWSLFSILVVSEVSYQLWAVINGVWQFGVHMPLHLCGVASIISILALWKRSQFLVQLAVFIGIVPALLALVTPDIPHGYQHFRFWKFFIHHMAISWSSIFLILTSKHTLTIRSLITSFSLLVGYAVVVGVWINPMVGSNYLYLSNTPAATTLLDLFGEGFWYYIKLGMVALATFFILLAIFTIQDKRHQ